MKIDKKFIINDELINEISVCVPILDYNTFEKELYKLQQRVLDENYIELGINFMNNHFSYIGKDLNLDINCLLSYGYPIAVKPKDIFGLIPYRYIPAIGDSFADKVRIIEGTYSFACYKGTIWKKRNRENVIIHTSGISSWQCLIETLDNPKQVAILILKK